MKKFGWICALILTLSVAVIAANTTIRNVNIKNSAITASTIDGTPIGQTTQAAISGTTITGAVINSTVDNTIIGGTTAAAATVTNLTVNHGIPQTGGAQYAPFGSTCSTAGYGSFCTTTYTWPVAWPDAAYVPVCIGHGEGHFPTLSIAGWDATTITVQVDKVYNDMTGSAFYAGVNCWAVHQPY